LVCVCVSFEFTHARCFYSVVEVSMSFQWVFVHEVDFISQVMDGDCCQMAE
jgi:hypothetical protein